MILTLILALSVILVTYNYLQGLLTLRRSRLASRFPLPLIGHAHHLLGSSQGFYKKLHKLLKDKSSFGLFFGPFFFPIFHDEISIPHLLRFESKMQEKPHLYTFLEDIAKNSIFVTKGPEHRENKKVLVETVSTSNLKEYIKSFNKNARILCETLAAKEEGGEFNLEPELRFTVISILLETIMGLERTVMTKPEILKFGNEFSKSLEYICRRGYSLVWHPEILYRASKLSKLCKESCSYVQKICADLILARQRLSEKEDNSIETNFATVIIDSYFKAKKSDGTSFTNEEILDNVVSLVSAGFETTVASIGFLLMLLGIHQDVQKKVVAEIMDKVKENDGDMTINDLNDLVYLDRVISETWRLYPPVSGIGRRLTEDMDFPNGGHLRKGSDIWIMISMVHRNAKIYSNPDVFNPDNFLPENVKIRPYGSYMPFGFGSRKCFGNVFSKLLIKTTAFHLLKRFDFYTNTREEDFELSMEVTLRNKFGFPVSIVPKNKSE